MTDAPDAPDMVDLLYDGEKPTSVLNNHDLSDDAPSDEILAHLAESRALVEARKTRPVEPEPPIRPKPDAQPETKGVQTNRDWIHSQWAGEADPNWIHRARGRFTSALGGLAEIGGEAGQGFRDAGAAMRVGVGEAREGLGEVGGVGERISRARVRVQGLAAYKNAAEKAFNHDLRGGYRLKSKVRPRRRDSLSIEGEIFDGDKKIGSVSRMILDTNRLSQAAGLGPDDSGLIAMHAEAHIDPRYQGSGIMAEINARGAEFYDRMGVDAVQVHANLDVGGAAWASEGFKFDRKSWSSGVAVGTVPTDVLNLTRFLGGAPGASSKEDAAYYGFDSRDDALNRMGLKANSTALRALMDDLDAAYQGVIDGTYTPQDVYYTGYDHQWTETVDPGLTNLLGGSNEVGRTVTMWPGKKALMGSDWQGTNRNYLRDFLAVEARALDRSKKTIRARRSASAVRKKAAKAKGKGKAKAS